MKLVVAGSRGFHRPRYLKVLEEAIKQFEIEHNVTVTEIVHGGNMQSADFLGWLYASRYGLAVKVFPANWDKYGKRAGILRNLEQAEYGDGLVTLWDGTSPGTKHMQDAMKEKNKPVLSTFVPHETEEDKVKFISSFPLDDSKTVIKSIK